MNTHPAVEPARKLSLLIVDDEPASMRALCDTLEYEGYQTYGYTSATDALAAMRERSFDLLLADLQMPGTNGIDLMKSAQLVDPTLVAVIMTGHGALETAVAAMKAGALDFLEKPYEGEQILRAVRAGLEENDAAVDAGADRLRIQRRMESLTARERQVLDLIMEGASNKVIAGKLAISPRTVEIYRANVMSKMRADSLSDLIRSTITAGAA